MSISASKRSKMPYREISRDVDGMIADCLAAAYHCWGGG